MTRLFITVLYCLTTSLIWGQTQLEMNEKANKDYQKADKNLNIIYQNILKEYNKDTTFIRNFKNAQRLWIQFRDAEMKAKYPDRESGYYGSVQPMCWSMYLTDLTNERLTKLKIWLTGIKEGDVCTGSVKVKP